MKRALKYLFRGLLFIVAAVVVYFLAAIVLTLIPVNRGFEEPASGIEVFLISNGAHVDICVPKNAAGLNWDKLVSTTDFGPANTGFKYISFGWGDRKFYTETPQWSDLKAATALNALFAKSPCALHVTYLEHRPVPGDLIKSIKLTNASYRKMAGYIASHFRLNAQQRAMRINCCNYKGVNDNFYEARGNYTMFRTSNEWTNETLKAANVKTACWAPFEQSVLYHFK